MGHGGSLNAGDRNQCEGCSVQGETLDLTSGKCVHVMDKVLELLVALLIPYNVMGVAV